MRSSPRRNSQLYGLVGTQCDSGTGTETQDLGLCQGSTNFLFKGYTVNILGFVGCKISVVSTQLRC